MKHQKWQWQHVTGAMGSWTRDKLQPSAIFTTRQYRNVLVKIMIMTNIWHEGQQTFPRVVTLKMWVTSEQILVRRSHFQHLHRLSMPKSIKTMQAFISQTSGAPHHCAIKLGEIWNEYRSQSAIPLIAVLCSVIRRTTISA
jgi:hypothetical protein